MLTDAGNVVHNLCDPVGYSIFQPVKLKWSVKWKKIKNQSREHAQM
jgi:hypothetical protein